MNANSTTGTVAGNMSTSLVHLSTKSLIAHLALGEKSQFPAVLVVQELEKRFDHVPQEPSMDLTPMTAKTIRNILVNEHGLTTENLGPLVMDVIQAQVDKFLKGEKIESLIEDQVAKTLNSMAKANAYDNHAIKDAAMKAATEFFSKQIVISLKQPEPAKTTSPQLSTSDTAAYRFSVYQNGAVIGEASITAVTSMLANSPDSLLPATVTHPVLVAMMLGDDAFFGPFIVKRIK